ncbi:hypothetical protein C3941_04685 [Kaistia algarum]|uniref:hypothetical protein n=1 Tax=Kaistia algarum TaxID=2083279 RepID=UPI000CE889C6|nr:hypothetical protein [Kaistia algarum]MCX5516023.1 hypothetical protein [Kaistia algarum]PPE80626.1 hypothetical protein C3941_04685 [Kaistia algarum]
MTNRFWAGAGLFLVLGLSACQSSNMVPASQATAGGDQTGEAAACTARMAQALGIKPEDVTVGNSQLNADGSQTMALIAVRGDRATCTANAAGNVVSFRAG